MGNEHETAVRLLAQLFETKFNFNAPGGVAGQVDQATEVTTQMLNALAAQAGDPNIAALANYVNYPKGITGSNGVPK